MSLNYNNPEFVIERDQDKCIECRVCARQCANEAHFYDEDLERMREEDINCVNCHRCVTLCPTNALVIKEYPLEYKKNSNWTGGMISNIQKQANTGGILLTGMGNPTDKKIYWDHILLNASQVTNPSIDPLREPMELKTILGRKPDKVEFDEEGKVKDLPPQLELETPIMFGAMSFGSISINACKSLAQAANEMGMMYNTGEGGLHEDLYPYKDRTIVQVASGRFGVHQEYLNAGAAIEIKIGQGAKPGIGGHLPGEKVGEEVSKTRMIPKGTDAISPAPHHDIYSIEDLRQLIYALKEATNYEKPVSVKIAAVHNVAAIASGIASAGADIIAIDGYRGGTGAAPTMIRDNVGIPIELALAAVDSRLREQSLRNKVSLVVSGSIRNSADIVKAVALGADAVYVASAALIALGCHMCQKCYTGKCNWGIATQNPELVKRLNPEIGVERVKNLIEGWSHEIKEILGGMGINALESLRGNRLMLRGIDLTEKELEILGIKHAGE
ncbi:MULTISPECIES: FMN-binding glutamate synthase family protein [unclassified Candidatus Frackibacter]|uniref:FMN-binding glutamate synthase family protein n=1 Tax=unclassified Candidatus Frackibacter TaxID=2648818 RepID=UPI000793CE83|nr:MULTISPECIES: FMN-binding glutamate synthase family protein [unclassified Candidatus Frackibacter]KXS42593.1 MAG: glutamate synthase (NADPH) GltB2 subunit [Candidatus Frackibacter sp. T328-2]SDC15843.1 Glutamate synthase domain-containing protein 2 [Candidatus Frackibacter sp. WG11]SEM45804.1 Glutamate synthase domain-containing protein 2 [Candidatus Frackibacter sp. WG12]SFL48025.1 Glutamate synthase domain-containing protein 2 [Candidatus Frackibacter sp. WG13]